MALPWITGLGIQAGGGQDTVGLAFPHPHPLTPWHTQPLGGSGPLENSWPLSVALKPNPHPCIRGHLPEGLSSCSHTHFQYLGRTCLPMGLRTPRLGPGSHSVWRPQARLTAGVWTRGPQQALYPKLSGA